MLVSICSPKDWGRPRSVLQKFPPLLQRPLLCAAPVRCPEGESSHGLENGLPCSWVSLPKWHKSFCPLEAFWPTPQPLVQPQNLATVTYEKPMYLRHIKFSICHFSSPIFPAEALGLSQDWVCLLHLELINFPVGCECVCVLRVVADTCKRISEHFFFPWNFSSCGFFRFYSSVNPLQIFLYFQLFPILMVETLACKIYHALLRSRVLPLTCNILTFFA